MPALDSPLSVSAERVRAVFRRAAALAVLLAIPVGAQDPVREPAPRLRSVTFEGREVYPVETLERIAGIAAGAPWSPELPDEVVRRLAAWPYLAEVGPARTSVTAGGGVDLVVPVRELRAVGSVRLHGNDALLDSTLLEASGLRSGAPLGDQVLREAAEGVLDRYHQDGFLLAQVESDVVTGPHGRADVDLRIREGRRVYLRQVRIDGAEQISPAEALSVLELQPRRLFGLISRGHYVPSRLAGDLVRLRDYYRARGFLAVEVGFAGLELDDRRVWAVLSLQVREGPRYRLLGSRIEGNRLFSPRHFEAAGLLVPAAFYSRAGVEAARRRIVRWYERHADIVPRVAVRHEYSGPDGVLVVYEVREEEHYRTGRVTITGNRRTRDRAIRKDVTLVPGQPFTLEELERTETRLRAGAALSAFELTDRPGIEPNVRDVEIRVVERPQTGWWEVGGGATAGAGEVAYFRVLESNFDLLRLPRAWNDWEGAFRGGGQTLEVEVIPGTSESEYRFRFVEPYLFRSDVGLHLGGGTSIYDRRSYDEVRWRGAARVDKHFDADRRVSIGLGYVADAVRIDDVDADAPADVVAAGGHSFLAYPRLELKYDGLEPGYFSGPRGFHAALHADHGASWTGSELDFTRVTASADWFQGFLDERADYQHVLRVSADAGWIEARGEAVPIFERFFLGGPRTFAGFRYRRLGPGDGRTPLGGSGMVHGSVEYSLPIVRPELRAFAQFQWGDLEPRLRDIDFDRFRTAAGGGLQIRLKLGEQRIPVTLYWMQALASEPSDREQLFSFSAGLNF